MDLQPLIAKQSSNFLGVSVDDLSAIKRGDSHGLSSVHHVRALVSWRDFEETDEKLNHAIMFSSSNEFLSHPVNLPSLIYCFIRIVDTLEILSQLWKISILLQLGVS